MLKQRSLLVPMRVVRRPGMTLIELIVAIGIIVLLSSLLIAFWPGIQDQQLAAEGASQLQGALASGSAGARRDGRVEGVRLLAGLNNPLQVSSYQRLEQPDDFTLYGSSVSGLTGTTITFSDVSPPALDFTNGVTDPTLYAVRTGDYLEVCGGGPLYQITAVAPNSLSLQPTMTCTVAASSGAPVIIATGPTTLTVGNLVGNLTLSSFIDIPLPGLPTPMTVQITGLQAGNVVTLNNPGPPQTFIAPLTLQSHGIPSAMIMTPLSQIAYRIIRAPRPVGEEVLQLPSNIVVDLSLNTNPAYVSNPLPLSLDSSGNFLYLDILFAPSGAVLTPAVSSDPFLALWVRNLNGLNQFDKGPTILAVFVRSGQVSAHPVNEVPPDPFLFVRDGRSE